MTVHEPTDGRYKRGCRCDGCRAAHREYTAAQRARALENGTTSHGTRAAYDCGCRCDQCMEARRVSYFTLSSEYQPKFGRRWPA